MLRTAFGRCGLAGVITVALSACGGSSNTPTPTTPSVQATVTAVAITGTATLTVSGQANQLAATATLSDGTAQNVTSAATWQSSNAAVATISGTGLLTAVAAGTTTITATMQGRSGTLVVTVSLAGATGTGDVSMTAPFVNAADIVAVNEAFSTTTSAPWRFAHNGIDFFPATATLKSFQAASTGIVSSVNQRQNGSNWQVNVRIQFNTTFSLEYIFETFSTSQADGDAQRADILVANGQAVSQGQLIGRLHAVGSGAHVHFGLLKNGTAICPEPYFTADTRQSVLALVQRTYPGSNMCY